MCIEDHASLTNIVGIRVLWCCQWWQSHIEVCDWTLAISFSICPQIQALAAIHITSCISDVVTIRCWSYTNWIDNIKVIISGLDGVKRRRGHVKTVIWWIWQREYHSCILSCVFVIHISSVNHHFHWCNSESVDDKCLICDTCWIKYFVWDEATCTSVEEKHCTIRILTYILILHKDIKLRWWLKLDIFAIEIIEGAGLENIISSGSW